MREILFKAKGQTTGKWFEGLLVRFDQDVCRIKDKYHEEWLCDASTVCQYTGLTDKNGKKIWENDIIRYNKDLFILKWNPDCAHFAAHSENNARWTPCVNVGTMNNSEVAGNIFDNPELLGQEENTDE